MLELLQSNRMSLLLETLCTRLQEPQDPFEPVLVVVQSQGIGQWLKVELAKRLGIAANIECLLPAELIWRLYQKVLPPYLDTTLPDESPFSRTQMTWRLMQCLPDSQEPSIKSYLKEGMDFQLRLYQLSHVVSGLFDQYLIYRPDWIQQWDQGDDAKAFAWQSQLWREINSMQGMDERFHRANLHTSFVSALQDNDSPYARQLPAQLNVLGISSLPAMHLQTLQTIAKHHQVSIYFLNPCEHYWGDIETQKTIAKKSIRELLNKEAPLNEEDYLEVGNPLLSSTGKQGREFLELLLEESTVQSVDLFQSVEANTMLDQIHADILNLEFGGEYYDVTQPPIQREILSDDRSVQIHCTHSRLREIEVLLDQILGMIDRSNGTVEPSNIIVMAPDITMYAPFIQAVFQNKIAYSITDKPATDESTLQVAFNKLIALPDSRLTASDVMDLLEIPAVADKFNLSETDVHRIQHWIREAGIRYEMDGSSRAEKWQLPDDDYNSWRFGLDRLLLGIMMETNVGLYKNIAPVELNPNDATLIGTLCEIIDLLVAHREKLSESHSAENWQEHIHKLIADLMLVSNEQEIAVNQIMDALANLTQQTQETYFNEPITPRLFRFWLTEQIQQQPQNRGFVSGGVTFATLVPMRSIPYKCVCMIGMNDREFPREDKPLSFDLMAQDYRKGDRSRRNDDRYLFLEALLSASSNLYISYVGRGQRDNKEKPPSELVSELLDYTNGLYSNFSQVVHPLQPFSPQYYTAGSRIRSYSQHWHKAVTEAQPARQFIDAPLATEIELNQLTQLTGFFRHPTQYFFNRQLGVFLQQADETVKDTETFLLGGLERYQLTDNALSALLDNKPIEQWKATVRASGLILPGPMGQQQLSAEVALATSVANEVKVITTESPSIYAFELSIGDHRLEAEIPLSGDQYIAPRTGELRAKQRLEAWIHHLALCAHGYDRESTMIYRTGSGKNRKVKTEKIQPVSASLAIEHLQQLANYFAQGSVTPLFFLPEASLSYVVKNSFEAASKTFLMDRPGSESTDPYYNRVFELPRDLNQDFAIIADTIWQPIIEFSELELKGDK